MAQNYKLDNLYKFINDVIKIIPSVSIQLLMSLKKVLIQWIDCFVS